MIGFFKNWIEQIALSIVIVSIIELILPSGNLKKYIKLVLGIYVVFCIISPFINNLNIFKLEDLEFTGYNQVQTSMAIKQESMNKRMQSLYIEELKKNIEKKVDEIGYKLNKCEINADLDNTSANPRDT